jgi:hypothetical protein
MMETRTEIPGNPPVRDRIFICYRRDDARGASGRLYDWLRVAFGRERVFRDVHSIGLGLWSDKIDQALQCSRVCFGKAQGLAGATSREGREGWNLARGTKTSGPSETRGPDVSAKGFS